MGSYDTIHAGTRCGQTKALGKSLRNLTLGSSPVRCYPAALTAEAYEIEMRGETPAYADSFNVAMPAGGYLIVRDTVLTDWADQPDPALPLVDNLGHPATVQDAEAPTHPADDHVTCARCADVRNGRSPSV